ncbi:uncharacterized protein LOC131024788 [Salvia miltiorrhiza]|uniref:uncharacterized protein LOC131024788 n=1 Tax=Salvia miltiorrhiza TaxID=226208 RepID=UPI0025AD986B|nr:uncharacterized protein LOC131024788 [Salvia miltiorrhiza]
MEERMAGLKLSAEEDELLIDDDIADDTTVAVELCLVGRFLTEQPINFNLMRSRLASIWRPGKGVFMKDIGDGRFIFQFFHELDLQRILDNGPWSYGNFPLILHKLKKGDLPSKVPLDTLPFWIQIHDLPAGFLTEKVGRLLGNFIGNFLEYDSTNSSGVWRQYMRIRVGINVTEPLKRFKRLKNTDGTSFQVSFKYERLNIFCFLCGRLGHSENFCNLRFTLEVKEVEREWGAWLKAADRRSVSLAGDKWLRADDGGSNPSGAAAEARVSSEPLQSDPKRKARDFGSKSLPIMGSRHTSDPIPQITHSLVLRDISNAPTDRELMQLDDSSIINFEERKRRRGTNTHAMITSTSSEIFPAGIHVDVSDESDLVSAGSNGGVGQAQ